MNGPSKVTSGVHDRIDPVLDVLTELNRKSPQKLDGTRVADAINEYNELIKELKGLRELKENWKREPEAASKLQDALEKERKKNDNLKIEVEALKTRLSKVLGDKLTNNNPQITDLSDPDRPVLLAEKFKLVYDEEWVNAYEELVDKHKVKEPGVLNFLAEIIRKADAFSKEALKQMIERISESALVDVIGVKFKRDTEKGSSVKGIPIARVMADSSDSDGLMSKRLVKAYIKELGHLSVTGLTDLYGDLQLKPMLSKLNIKENYNNISAYTESIVKFTWKMQLADPPMALRWQEKGDRFSKDISQFYTQTGTTVEYAVWPTVLLHQDGPVVTKGIVVAV